MTETTKDTQPIQSAETKARFWHRTGKKTKIALLIIGAVLLVPILAGAYMYAMSPTSIRSPKLEHYHYRMQILVNGKAENFAKKAYQQDYEKGQCSADLPAEPIHFHDGKDQLVHIHWQNITGGMVMKYYGWNYIGGLNNALGYKIDGVNAKKVPIQGAVLPGNPDVSKFHIYTGDENKYKAKNFNDWLHQDIETFFGNKSSFAAHHTSSGLDIASLLFPKVSAHGAVDDGHSEDAQLAETTTAQQPSKADLARINNLIGNVVIFVQDKAPSDQQIKERFNDLEPLSASTCGG